MLLLKCRRYTVATVEAITEVLTKFPFRWYISFTCYCVTLKLEVSNTSETLL